MFRYIKELEEIGLVAVKRTGERGTANEVYLNPDVIYFGKYAFTEDMPKFSRNFKANTPVKRNKKVAKEG
jgi:hypothetical protein